MHTTHTQTKVLVRKVGDGYETFFKVNTNRLRLLCSILYMMTTMDYACYSVVHDHNTTNR